MLSDFCCLLRLGGISKEGSMPPPGPQSEPPLRRAVVLRKLCGILNAPYRCPAPQFRFARSAKHSELIFLYWTAVGFESMLRYASDCTPTCRSSHRPPRDTGCRAQGLDRH